MTLTKLNLSGVLSTEAQVANQAVGNLNFAERPPSCMYARTQRKPPKKGDLQKHHVSFEQCFNPAP